MCTVMPRHPDGCLLQETWKREVSSVQTACLWGWEWGSFTPLVFSTSGWMGRAATVTYKRLASLLAMKRELPHSIVTGRLSFSVLRSAVMCLRGFRSACNHVPCNSMDIAVHGWRNPLLAQTTNHAPLFYRIRCLVCYSTILCAHVLYILMLYNVCYCIL